MMAEESQLSRRELEIIRALGNGYSIKQIADLHNLRESTVKAILCKIYEKLGLADHAVGTS
jgi:DNA-binding NarL/FixJ family response regulator